MSSLRDYEYLEQRVRFGALFGLYSSLLTERQRLSCELMLREDLSIAELGEELGTTRQGAHDLIRRSRELLEEIERELGLCALRERLKALASLVEANQSKMPPEVAREMMNMLMLEGTDFSDV